MSDWKHPDFHDTNRPMAVMEADWPSGSDTGWHSHPRGQALYSLSGVMMVQSCLGSWIVPPQRLLWLTANVTHNVRMSGDVKMRTAYIDAAAVPHLPDKTCVLNVSPLLRELLVAATQVPLDYQEGTREAHLMQLLADELSLARVMPLHLPIPEEPRLYTICQNLMTGPDDTSTASQWAQSLAISAKTLQRLFRRETGLTFSQWRQQARLLYALERIACGAPLAEVALDCGYASQSAFTVMFKRHFGVPPLAFNT